MQALNITSYQTLTQDRPHHDTSDRYSFIPTSRALATLAGIGWQPVSVTERATRRDDHRGFQTHLVRLRKADRVTQPAVVGETIPEIVMMNAHDRSSSFRLMAGLFRFVCANGMVVSDAQFAPRIIRHLGYTDAAVLNAIHEAEEGFARIGSRVAEFRAIPLHADEQLAYAESALALRWEAGKAPDPRALLTLHRREDADPTLWHTFQRVQENLLRGVTRQAVARATESVRPAKAIRAITGVTQGVGLNQALWALTEKMAELKAS
jgi:hypothetical protein